MSKAKEIDNLKSFLYDFADSVSYNEEVSTEYLTENGVDIEKFVCKGLKKIEALQKKKDTQNSKSLFFKRVVLAADIVYNLYNERTFGHVKFQKLMYLCEQASNMELTVRYTKQAAGPFDWRFMHSVDKEFKRLKWFDVEIKQENGYKNYIYSFGENVESYKPYFNNYYNDSKDSIKWLIETFRKPPTKKVELVATIYSCLDELIKNKEVFTSALLIERVFKWSEEKKKKFTSEDILKAHKWMNQNSLIPKG